MMGSRASGQSLSLRAILTAGREVGARALPHGIPTQRKWGIQKEVGTLPEVTVQMEKGPSQRAPGSCRGRSPPWGQMNRARDGLAWRRGRGWGQRHKLCPALEVRERPGGQAPGPRQFIRSGLLLSL